ncbi:Solute carrier family 2, facilitated glucose transporter member 8, partial [Gryllus bimaculatus]
MAASLLAPLVLVRTGRRAALVASGGAAALAHAVHVVSLRAAEATAGGAAVSFGALCSAAAAHALALGPLPLALAAELAPPPAREATAALAAAATGAAWWAASRMHQELWGRGLAYVSFYLSTACCGLAAWLSFAQLPETKNLSLQQVQAALLGKVRKSTLLVWSTMKPAT